MSEHISTLSVEIAKLALKKGDVLVVKSSEIISEQTLRSIREGFEGHLPEGVKALVIDKTLSLAVLTKEEIEARVA